LSYSSLASHNSQQTPKIFFTSIKARMDTFDVGLSYTSNGPGAVSIGLTGKKVHWWSVSLY